MAFTSGQRLSALETMVLKRMRSDFLSRRDHRFGAHVIIHRYGVEDEDTASRLVDRMKVLGAVDERENSMPIFNGEIGKKTYFVISPRIIEIVDQREAAIATRNLPADRVSAAETWVRTHPTRAKLFIALVVLGFLAALGNQLWELAEKIVGAANIN